MTPVLLAASSAAIWGTADYSGGKATRHAPVLAVTLVSQLVSLPLLAVILAIDATPARLASLGWGAAGGLFGWAGLILLYRGLAAGAMAVVAPVTAVTAAVVPLAAGLLLDRRPGPIALAGVGCAIVAIALVSVARHARPVTVGLVAMALAAGALFGLFFVCFERAGDGAGLWPLAGGRLASVALGVALVWKVGTPLGMGGAALGWTLLTGVFDMTANALFLIATHSGLLSVVGPVAALYPASTVLLSMVVDGERVRPPQVAGLCLAALALVLVAA